MILLLVTVVTDQDHMPFKVHIVFYLLVSRLITNLNMFPSIARVIVSLADMYSFGSSAYR